MGVADILTYLLVAIKTGYAGKQKYTYSRYNQFCLELLNLLYKQNFIEGYSIDFVNKKVKIKLKYYNNRPLISDLDLLTFPSFKNYLNSVNLKKVVKKYDFFYVFTSKGLISSYNVDLLNEINSGGQVLFGLKIHVE
jgi:small subunit ribosomal protein S8